MSDDRPPFHECADPSAWFEWPTRLLDDGRLLAFEILLFGGRIHVVRDVHDLGSMEVYDYQYLMRALRAFMSWDGTGEPADWYRHRPSNRRRPDGDPGKEYIAT